MTLDMQGPNKTIQDVLDFFVEKHDLQISMIITGTKPLYADYLDHTERLGQTVEEVYRSVNKIEEDFPKGMKYLILTISCQVHSSGDEANCPAFRYILG